MPNAIMAQKVWPLSPSLNMALWQIMSQRPHHTDELCLSCMRQSDVTVTLSPNFTAGQKCTRCYGTYIKERESDQWSAEPGISCRLHKITYLTFFAIFKEKNIFCHFEKNTTYFYLFTSLKRCFNLFSAVATKNCIFFVCVWKTAIFWYFCESLHFLVLFYEKSSYFHLTTLFSVFAIFIFETSKKSGWNISILFWKNRPKSHKAKIC